MWLGFFYGGNTAGAVIGSLLAGFYLLRVGDINVTTYVAAALNAAVALFDDVDDVLPLFGLVNRLIHQLYRALHLFLGEPGGGDQDVVDAVAIGGFKGADIHG